MVLIQGKLNTLYLFFFVNWELIYMQKFFEMKLFEMVVFEILILAVAIVYMYIPTRKWVHKL